MKNLTVNITIFACLFPFILQNIEAKNIKNNNLVIEKNIEWKGDNALITQIIDWKSEDPFNKKPPRYLNGKACGNITIDLPKWVEIHLSMLTFKKLLPNKDLAGNGFFESFTVNCFTDEKKINWPIASYGYGFFNDKTNRWQITDKYKKKVLSRI